MSDSTARKRKGLSLLCLLSTITTGHAAAVRDLAKRGFDWNRVQSVVAFGDSYTFVQGTYGYPGYSFMGSYLPDNFTFTPEQILDNKIVQKWGGTASGGPNWVEYLTECGLEPGLTSPATCKMPLWDFAFAGADIAEEHLPLHHDYSTQLVNQTQQYLTYALPTLTKKTCHHPARALVAIWIGINDINDANRIYYNSTYTSFDFATLYDTLIDTLFADAVKPLHDAGYRDFMFVNLPPLDRTSANQQSASPRPNTTMIEWWGNSLERHAKLFEEQNEANAMIFDANTFLNGVLDSPAQYGITNTTHFCAGAKDPEVLTDWEKFGCPVPMSQYFWFDSGHMTSRVHEILVDEMIKFLKQKSL